MSQKTGTHLSGCASAILRRRRGSCARVSASAIWYASGAVVVSVIASENLDKTLVQLLRIELTLAIVASVPILAHHIFQLNGAAVDVATLELFNGPLRILLAIIADDALVLANVAMGGTIAHFACLAHEVLEILPAE